MKLRVGIGYDVHALVPDRPCILGGVEIPSELGLKGHSDADCLSHAICDALLGACALGDLGKFFPDTDPQFKGVSSLILLEQTYQKVREQGYRLGNCDTVIITEVPKLAPYIESMRTQLAKVLECDLDQISVKATTHEKLGSLGRKEGLAVQAIVCLEKQ